MSRNSYHFNGKGCTDSRGNDRRWTVIGELSGHGSGILEWCDTRDEAESCASLMRRDPRCKKAVAVPFPTSVTVGDKVEILDWEGRSSSPFKELDFLVGITVTIAGFQELGEIVTIVFRHTVKGSSLSPREWPMKNVKLISTAKSAEVR